MTEPILPQFRSKDGTRTFSGLSTSAIDQMHQSLSSDYGFTSPQIAEAASYSMAMVARFALGLSATGGKVCAVVRDCLAGQVALATIRHLVNAGANAQALVICENPDQLSNDLRRQMLPLQKLAVPLPDLGSATQVDEFTQFLGSAHNVLFGVYIPGSPPDPFISGISELLNEERTPVHCVEAPAGVHPDTGIAMGSALYASSTLSLGAPLQGLYPGRDYVGRHYVCDISFSQEIYTAVGSDLTGLFSDQPVVQIFPIVEE